MKKLFRRFGDFALLAVIAVIAVATMVTLMDIPAMASVFPPVSAPQAPATIDLTAIVTALMGVLAAVVSRWLIPYLRAQLTDAQREKMDAAINVGVYAAEEIYRSGHGDEKLQYVKDYLTRKGFAVDLDQIKAAVKQMRDAETRV